jgi:hypothetical protein
MPSEDDSEEDRTLDGDSDLNQGGDVEDTSIEGGAPVDTSSDPAREGTKKNTSINKAGNKTKTSLDKGGNTSTDEGGADDPVWLNLLKRPFFRNANSRDQQGMYYEELDRLDKREEREKREDRIEREKREEREFQLKKLEIENRSQGGHSQQNVTGRGNQSGKVHLPTWEQRTRADTYLSVCEKLFLANGTPQEKWVGYLVPNFPDKARNIYNRLPIEKANDYEALKKEILAQYAVSTLVYRKNFFTWEKASHHTYAEYIQLLIEQLDLWVGNMTKQGEEPDYKELLLRYRLDTALPEELNLFLTDKQADSVADCVEFADNYVVNRKVFSKTKTGGNSNQQGKQPDRGSFNKSAGWSTYKGGSTNTSWSGTSSGSQGNHNPARDGDHRPNSKGYANKGGSNYKSRYCDFCKKEGHERKECYADPNSPRFMGSNRSWLRKDAPSFVPKREPDAQPNGLVSEVHTSSHRGEILNPLYRDYSGKASIQGGPLSITYLRDTGSTLSLVAKECLEGDSPNYTGEHVTVRGINQMTGTYPLANIHVDSDIYTGLITAAVVKHSPLPGVGLLFGNDLFASSKLLDLPCGVFTLARIKRGEH